MQIILDFGSGNTCNNDKKYIKRMIDELKKVDTGKHEVVIKWQLFKEAGDNIPLTHDCFDYAYDYAKKLGYKTTASVFDVNSLKFLLQYVIPFVKISCRKELYHLIDLIPRGIPVYVSYDNIGYLPTHGQYTKLACISLYPASIDSYNAAYRRLNTLRAFGEYHYPGAVSDHTVGLELVKTYNPDIWEKHYKLPDSTGLDAGSWAITPKELKEIL